VFALIFVATAVYQPYAKYAAIAFSVYIALMTLYYLLVVRHRETFSEEEKTVLFKAYLMKCKSSWSFVSVFFCFKFLKFVYCTFVLIAANRSMKIRIKKGRNDPGNSSKARSFKPSLHSSKSSRIHPIPDVPSLAASLQPSGTHCHCHGHNLASSSEDTVSLSFHNEASALQNTGAVEAGEGAGGRGAVVRVGRGQVELVDLEAAHVLDGSEKTTTVSIGVLR
jgi:hypothetical protein